MYGGARHAVQHGFGQANLDAEASTKAARLPHQQKRAGGFAEPPVSISQGAAGLVVAQHFNRAELAAHGADFFGLVVFAPFFEHLRVKGGLVHGFPV